MEIEGTKALVTGAASGLGAAVVSALADRGAHVCKVDLAYDEGAGVRSRGDCWGCAVEDAAALEAGFSHFSGEGDPPRIIVNCAGIATPGNVVRRAGPMPLAEFSSVLDVNLIGSFNVARLAASSISGADPVAGDEQGVIINISSIAAEDGQVGQAAYSASKGAINAMTLPLARELGRFGIRVLAIMPGVFETPMTTGLPEKSRAIVFAAKPPFPARAGSPAELADLVVAMVGSTYLNGACVRLDGGLRMPAKI